MKAIVMRGPGGPEVLELREVPRPDPGPGEVRVRVASSGLNRADLSQRLGRYPAPPGSPQDILGLELAGTVDALGSGVRGVRVGDAVMGIAPQAFDSHVVTPADLVARKPDSLTFAEAASVPIAYLTAAYGLQQLAALQPGERVLIHAAAGGVGMAAVHIAQRIGAEIHATVGSAEKRHVLEALGVRHVYSSRTLDFAKEVLAGTDGRGVDVVLNSLSDDFIAASFGEWSIAKNVYVATNSGWFSCRTACYLAAGKPAVVQETGWSKFVPSGRGVIAFSRMSETIDALDRVLNDPVKWRADAYEIAREYVAPDRILPPMIEAILNRPEQVANRKTQMS